MPRLRVVLVLAVLAAVPMQAVAEPKTAAPHARIPAWARKYNVNCSHCHYPAVPRLNAKGMAFKWAGYRMPEEIGEKTDIQKIEEYLAARVRIQYNYKKEQGEPAEVNSVSLPSASLFAAGPFGKTYGGYLEFEREEEGEVDLTAEASALWGKQESYGGVRIGQGHLLIGGALAGFDRPTGIAIPLPLAQPTTSVMPFRFRGDIVGLETFYVLRNRNRLSLRVLNAQPSVEPLGVPTAGAEAEPSTKRDFAVSNQFMWDDVGSGIAGMAYFGTVAGLDAAEPERNARYLRVGATANKIFRSVEVLGGYIYSRDRGLPTGGISPLTSSTMKGSAYWFSGQFTMPATSLTLFSRYEFLDPDTDTSDDALRRVLLGGVLPVNLPEYLRLGLEVLLDNPQSAAGAKRRALAAEVMLTF